MSPLVGIVQNIFISVVSVVRDWNGQPEIQISNVTY